MSKETLLAKLKHMDMQLDEMQESDTAQDDEELMWELGEAIGAVNNAIDILEQKKVDKK